MMWACVMQGVQRKRSAVQGRKSGNMAKDRLKQLLTADKTDISPEFLDMLKKDIGRTVARYMEVDSERMELGFGRMSESGRVTKELSLYTNIPIKSLNYKGTF